MHMTVRWKERSKEISPYPKPGTIGGRCIASRIESTTISIRRFIAGEK